MGSNRELNEVYKNAISGKKMSKLIKIAYKINIQKSIVCLYTGDTNLKKLKTKLFTTVWMGGKI